MLVSSLLFFLIVGLCLAVPAVILVVLIVVLRARDPNVLASFSLVTGILGFFLLPLSGSIAAIVSGNMALNQFRLGSQPGPNENLARAGAILGWIGLVLWLAGIIGIFLFLIPVTSVTTGG